MLSPVWRPNGLILMDGIFFSWIGLARTIPCKVFEQLVLFGEMVTNVSRLACELELFQSLLKPPQVDATARK